MCIDLQIPATTTRILLNHFKWDKEKLMERFYDGDQEKLFAEARVINPFRKGSLITRSRSSQSSLVNVYAFMFIFPVGQRIAIKIMFVKIMFVHRSNSLNERRQTEQRNAESVL